MPLKSMSRQIRIFKYSSSPIRKLFFHYETMIGIYKIGFMGELRFIFWKKRQLTAYLLDGQPVKQSLNQFSNFSVKTSLFQEFISKFFLKNTKKECVGITSLFVRNYYIVIVIKEDSVVDQGILPNIGILLLCLNRKEDVTINLYQLFKDERICTFQILKAIRLIRKLLCLK
ncbi:unnamed protein product [Paramecium octaurelia]|uniref:Uncharacterized protein n=1 Tax=Paramecium octaurelia TaxID=43137 RepID=A0A8S1YR94_PAROT|nr:unnamed protein product [Paramecium octaurelia]